MQQYQEEQNNAKVSLNAWFRHNVKRINYIIERYTYIYTYYTFQNIPRCSSHRRTNARSRKNQTTRSWGSVCSLNAIVKPHFPADISRRKHNRVRVEIISRLSSLSSPAFHRWDTRGAWESKRGRAEKMGEKKKRRGKKGGKEIGRKGGFPFLVGTYYETR